jgi:23S rRNA (adenine2030-N6)-methyltransferase
MLSYRHAYHAGNFADVLKHLVLSRVLEYLMKKDKPVCIIDTHAGAGTYSLTTEAAQKNREYANGIARLWQKDDLPKIVAEYVALVKASNEGGKLNAYPGSPYFERHYLREHDRLILCELHPNEIKALQGFAPDDARVKTIHGDGLAECLALLPPAERRGLVFIDPSYEIKTDYAQVVESVEAFHRRFATGVFAIWYPIVTRAQANALVRGFERGPYKRVMRFELSIRRAAADQGMSGCGMIVINAPWKLGEEIGEALPYLARELGIEGQGVHRADMLVGE